MGRRQIGEFAGPEPAKVVVLLGCGVDGHDDYQQAALTGGWASGTPEDALDTACGLYLGDPTAWQPDPPDESTATTTSG